MFYLSYCKIILSLIRSNSLSLIYLHGASIYNSERGGIARILMHSPMEPLGVDWSRGECIPSQWWCIKQLFRCRYAWSRQQVDPVVQMAWRWETSRCSEDVLKKLCEEQGQQVQPGCCKESGGWGAHARPADAVVMAPERRGLLLEVPKNGP